MNIKIIAITLLILSLSGFVDPYSLSGRNKLVWFRDHALHMSDNKALMASDVFRAHVLMDLNETLGGNLTFYIMKTRESGDDAERLAAEINEQLVYVCVKYDCDEIYYSESADTDFEHFINSVRHSLEDDLLEIEFDSLLRRIC